MVPQTQQRKPRNSAKVNLLISLVFHATIVLALVFFAARQGILGKQLRKIAVEMVKEKKQIEKPKEPEKPKEEPPKLETPKIVEAAKTEPPREAAQAPPPATVDAVPAFAPPPAEISSFVFEGGKAVETSSDPVQLYKSLVESTLRSRWERPADTDDHSLAAEVEVSVDGSGKITDPVWVKGSGNSRWDDTVRQALAKATSINRPPPANFPSRFAVRFDVVEAEPIAP